MIEPGAYCLGNSRRMGSCGRHSSGSRMAVSQVGVEVSASSSHDARGNPFRPESALLTSNGARASLLLRVHAASMSVMRASQ